MSENGSSQSEESPRMQTYVVYLPLNELNTPLCVRPVDERDPRKAALDGPAGAVSFYFYDEPADQISGWNPMHLNVSLMYFIDGAVFSFSQVKALPGNPQTLVDCMKSRGLDHVIVLRTGEYLPFRVGRDKNVSFQPADLRP